MMETMSRGQRSSRHRKESLMPIVGELPTSMELVLGNQI
jgi:hypothetical protein